MTPAAAFPNPTHDHGRCVADALAEAERVCRGTGARFTPQRRRVLEIVLASHQPVGAYDILARLNENGGRTAPITVYRALDFLMAQGLVHRLQSRNAYIGCSGPHAHENHGPAGQGTQFLICGGCGAVAEMTDPSIVRAIRKRAETAGFTIADPVVEVEGTCPNCAGGDSGAGNG